MKLKHSYSSLSEFEQCPKKYYHKRIAKDVVDPGSEASIYGERVHKAFEDRLRDGITLPTDLAKHEDKCQAILALGNIEPEKELVLTEDLIPTGWWAKDAWLRSKLDVFGVRKKRAMVLDWKTGKRKPDFLQLELSAMQTMLHYPSIEEVNTGYVWLRDDKIDKETYTRDELDGIVKKVQDKADRIEEAKDLGVWQAKPSPLCGWCPAKDICQYADKGRKR